MGRGSQIFCFLNEEKMPTELQQRHYYTSLHITPELKKLRREYRKELKKQKLDTKPKT